MKPNIKLLSLVLSQLFVACNTTNPIDKLLSDVWEKDQSIRHQMVELTKAVANENKNELVDSLIMLSHKVERIDAENMAVVDSLLRNGLPSGLTADSYKTIWIVIDHAPLERQIQHLALIEQMAHKGFIGYDEYATLYDRIAMKQNRPQRYGSQCVQFGNIDDVQIYVWPVENPTSLDSLRASVGMQPIAEQLKSLTQTTGFEAKYEPAMTIEEINRLREENN